MPVWSGPRGGSPRVLETLNKLPMKLVGKEQTASACGSRIFQFLRCPREGFFDRLGGDELQRIERSKQLINQLDQGVTGNYGGIFPYWTVFLLSTDCAERICRLTERIVARIAGSADGYLVRFATKFAVPAVAGYWRAERGIVPWPKMWPVEAAEHCYHLAVRAVRKDTDVAEKKLQLIAKLAMNSNRFIPTRCGASAVIPFGDETLGIRTSYRGKKVLAVRDQSLELFAGSRTIFDLLISQLRTEDLLLGGQGHAGTTQLPIPIQIDDKTILKPRFWIIDLEQLAAHGI